MFNPDMCQETDSESRANPRVVELPWSEEGLGFNIVESREQQNTRIYISWIVPGGVADRHDGLKRGDQLLSVNDVSVEGETREKALQLLKTALDSVKLIVRLFFYLFTLHYIVICLLPGTHVKYWRRRMTNYNWTLLLMKLLLKIILLMTKTYPILPLWSVLALCLNQALVQWIYLVLGQCIIQVKVLPFLRTLRY